MDVSVAHIVGAFTEAFRNRQRRKREEQFSVADMEPNKRSSLESTAGVKIPLRIAYQIRDYLLKLQVRHAEGSMHVCSAMSYELLLQEMRQKAGMLGIIEERWTIFAVPIDAKEGKNVIVTRDNWESVACALESGGKYWGLQLDCRL